MRNAKSICNVLQCGILINFVPIRHIWFSKSSLKQADIFALLRATTLAAYIKFDFANFVVRLSIVYICFCAHNTFHASLRAMFHHHHRKCRASSSGVARVAHHCIIVTAGFNMFCVWLYSAPSQVKYEQSVEHIVNWSFRLSSRVQHIYIHVMWLIMHTSCAHIHLA